MEYHADKLCISIAVSIRSVIGAPIVDDPECAGEVEVVVGCSIIVLGKGMDFMTAVGVGVSDG